MDACRLRPRAAETAELIGLRLGALRAEVGPLLEVGGEMRTLPDPRARVVMRGPALEASWPDGLRVRLRARADGSRGAVLDCSVSSDHDVRVGAIGVRVLGLSATRVLVDGYHSWDWAGVRDANAGGRGWWGAVWGAPGQACTSVANAAPPKLGPLLVRWNAGSSLGVMSVGAPEQGQHATGEPRLLGIALPAGTVLHGDPIRIAPLDHRSTAGAGLPRLRATDHTPGRRVAGWMSWNCLGAAATAADVVEAATSLAPPGGLVLLDDGWMPHWGDWVPRDDFDSTLHDLVDAVHATGRRFGLWLAPFLVDPQSRAAQKHSALLLRDAQGAPVVSIRSPRPQHVLDASLGASRLHLSALGRRLGRLGIDALKLDFLFAGALPGARHDGMSDIAALRAGVAAMVRAYRSEAPRGARVLGCGAPAAPLVGLLDACRSGDDAVVNVPPANVEPPPPPHFVHGEALLRAQTRNLAARAWLWGATMPPDVDAVTLAAIGDSPAPDAGYVQRWLQLATRSGGPLLDSDVPDGRVAAARLRTLRRAQREVHGTPARPDRSHDPLSGSALSHDDPAFQEWPEELPRRLASSSRIARSRSPMRASTPRSVGS
ncbi:MAG TPA: alpha-galactosidase [Candidatus Angelobacter sp.]|nr:alpha-galactosidase [Candidatus Angelobacter sp.]